MQARERGIRLRLLRPISLWPFPVKGFGEVNPEVKAYLAVELSALPRLEEDVRLAAGQRVPVESFLGGMNIPESSALVERAASLISASGTFQR